MSGTTEPRPDFLRCIIDAATTEFCLLAEELQSEHPEIADRIWDITHDQLESPLHLVGRADG